MILSRFIPVVVLLFSACSDPGLRLAYEVQVESADAESVAVGLWISGIEADSVFLQAFEADPYIGLTGLQLRDSEGRPVRHAQRVSATGRSTYGVNAPGSKLRADYQVQPGRPIGGGHGRHSTEVNGYLGEDFHLVSGRNLFLVPDGQFDHIAVSIQGPEGWAVETTWNAIEGEAGTYEPRLYGTGLEDLVNGAVAMGALTAREMTIGTAPVRVVLYEGWSSARQEELARRAWSLYEYMTRALQAPVPEPYTVILTPKTADGMNIHIPSTSYGQAGEMEPATPGRWLSVATRMAYRWLRHAPHRMELSQPSDFWFVEGASIYLGLQGMLKHGIVSDLEPYLYEAYRNHNRFRVSHFSKGIVPETYYTHSAVKESLVRHSGLALAHYLDAQIASSTDGEQDLQDVLEYAYWRREGVDLGGAIERVAGADLLSALYERTNPGPGSPPPEPLWHADGPVPGDQPPRLPWSRSEKTAVDTITLIVTGKTRSFLEACGCKSNMSGGITRRATLIEQIRKRRRSVAVIDAGNAFPHEQDVPAMDALTASELATYLEGLRRMEYGFSVIARNETYHGSEFLAAQTRKSPVPLINANLYHEGSLVGAPTYAIEVGRYRIAFIGLLQRTMAIEPSLYEDNTRDLETVDPKETVREYLPGLREQADFVGVIGELNTGLVHELVQEFPALDLVITTGHHAPGLDVIRAGGLGGKQNESMYGFLDDVLVIYANADVYGLHTVDIGIDETGRFASFEGNYLLALYQMREDSDMKTYLDSYYRSVAEQEELLEGNIPPLFEWDPIHDESKYVGTQECRTCHSAQWEQWQTTRHADAYTTLLDAHRHQFSKCVKCHVAGLNRDTGFSILEPDRSLANVQCEVCHGPGSSHVQRPSSETVRRLPSERTCLECHNSDHDDDFVYVGLSVRAALMKVPGQECHARYCLSCRGEGVTES